MATSNQTEVRVKLSGVHLCCDGCTDAVADGVAQSPGVSVECDKDEGTAVLVGRDPAAIQQALNGIAANGLYGESDDPSLAIGLDPTLPQGRVATATISDIHNCCGPCYRAIRKAIHHAPGVAADTGQPGATRFTVTGDFSPVDLARALHKGGFHARITT